MKKLKYIQGDISLHEIAELPEGVKPIKNNILAYGEVTGHQHELRAKQQLVFEDEQGNKFVQAQQETELIHDFKNRNGVRTQEEAAQQDKHLVQLIKPRIFQVMVETEQNPFTAELQKVVD